MKFIILNKLKFTFVLIVVFSLFFLTVCGDQSSFSKSQRCSIFQQNKIAEEIRDDYTKKIVFFIFLTYFYTNYF